MKTIGLYQAHNYGVYFATYGYTKAAIVLWLEEQGFTGTGMSARRIFRAYDEQIARG